MYNYCYLSSLLGTFLFWFVFFGLCFCFLFLLSIYLPIVDSKSISTFFFFNWDNYQLIFLACVVGFGEWQHVADSRLYSKKSCIYGVGVLHGVEKWVLEGHSNRTHIFSSTLLIVSLISLHKMIKIVLRIQTTTLINYGEV